MFLSSPSTSIFTSNIYATQIPIEAQKELEMKIVKNPAKELEVNTVQSKKLAEKFLPHEKYGNGFLKINHKINEKMRDIDVVNIIPKQNIEELMSHDAKWSLKIDSADFSLFRKQNNTVIGDKRPNSDVENGPIKNDDKDKIPMKAVPISENIVDAKKIKLNRKDISISKSIFTHIRKVFDDNTLSGIKSPLQSTMEFYDPTNILMRSPSRSKIEEMQEKHTLLKNSHPSPLSKNITQLTKIPQITVERLKIIFINTTNRKFSSLRNFLLLTTFYEEKYQQYSLFQAIVPDSKKTELKRTWEKITEKIVECFCSFLDHTMLLYEVEQIILNFSSRHESIFSVLKEIMKAEIKIETLLNEAVKLKILVDQFLKILNQNGRSPAKIQETGFSNIIFSAYPLNPSKKESTTDKPENVRTSTKATDDFEISVSIGKFLANAKAYIKVWPFSFDEYEIFRSRIFKNHSEKRYDPEHTFLFDTLRNVIQELNGELGSMFKLSVQYEVLFDDLMHVRKDFKNLQKESGDIMVRMEWIEKRIIKFFDECRNCQEKAEKISNSMKRMKLTSKVSGKWRKRFLLF